MSQNNYFLGFSDIARLERNQCHDNAKEFMSFIALFGKQMYPISWSNECKTGIESII